MVKFETPRYLRVWEENGRQYAIRSALHKPGIEDSGFMATYSEDDPLARLCLHLLRENDKKETP